MKFLLKKCLRKKAPEMKPGAILDAVISQSSATACKCLLYKLADYKRGESLFNFLFQFKSRTSDDKDSNSNRLTLSVGIK